MKLTMNRVEILCEGRKRVLVKCRSLGKLVKRRLCGGVMVMTRATLKVPSTLGTCQYLALVAKWKDPSPS